AALGAIPYADHIARRLGAPGSFERALLYNNVGVARNSAGDPKAARAWFEKAIDEPRTGEGDVELVLALGNLALVVDDPATRDRLLVREHDTLVQLLGKDHILTLRVAITGAMFVARPDLAANRLRDACGRLEQLHADAAAPISGCAYELGWLAE